MSFVKIKIPDNLKEEIKKALGKIANSRDSKIRKGMNETTKAIERSQAKFVVMAEDVSPPEILFHIPLLCEEKSIPYGYLSKKAVLGNAVNINVGTASIAILNFGSGNDGILDEIIKKINAVK